MSTEQLPEVETQPGTETQDLHQETPEIETEATEVEAIEPEVEQETEKEKLSGFSKRLKKFESKLAEKDREIEFYRRLVAEKETTPEPAKPLKLEDYGNIEDYVAATAAQVRAQVLQEVQSTSKQVTKQAQIEATYLARIEAAKATITDWDDVFENLDSDTVVQPETIQFVLESEVGPQISYYLAKNPEFNERLNKLSPLKRAAELGKLEDRLTTKVQPKAVTKAPPKVSSVKGTATQVQLDRSAATSYAEWKAARTQELAKRK